MGSRRMNLVLVNYINQTCVTILNNPLLKLNEEHSLYTKCYEEELGEFYITESKKMNMEIQDIIIDENPYQNEGEEEMKEAPDLMEVKQDYVIAKLNEVFEMFQLEPVVP